MNRLPERDLQQALSEASPGRQPRAPEAFWSDFKARARLRAQETPAPRRSPAIYWGGALAGACAAAILVAVGLQRFGGTARPAGETIKSVEVIASHSAVLIMEDEATQSTILWVVDMDADTPGGEDI